MRRILLAVLLCSSTLQAQTQQNIDDLNDFMESFFASLPPARVITEARYTSMDQAPKKFRPLAFLSSQNNRQQPLTCTAFYVKRDVLMTASHCVSKSTRQVKLNGDTESVEILANDRASDVAVLKTPILSKHTYKFERCCATFGDTVEVVGLMNHVAPQGFIYAKMRIANPLARVFQNWNPGLILDSGMIPGQSGSPILHNGRVVSVASGTGHPGSPFSKIGFGVPQKALKLVMKEAGK